MVYNKVYYTVQWNVHYRKNAAQKKSQYEKKYSTSQWITQYVR
jgi:hypothetical protein